MPNVGETSMSLSQVSLSSDLLLSFLKNNDLFSSVPESILFELLPELVVVHLGGGEILINQDEIADSLFVIISGRLRGDQRNVDGNEEFIGEFAAGEAIGEIGLLIQQKRTATIRAIRDCILLKVSQQVFDRFLHHYPEVMMSIARKCVKRLMDQKSNLHIKKSSGRCIAIVPAGKFEKVSEFSKILQKALSCYGETLLLDQHTFNELYNPGAAQIPLKSDKNAKIISWLYELEMKYKYIIYETDSTLSSWSMRCLRQVDKVYLVSEYDQFSELGEIEKFLFHQDNFRNELPNLILLYHKESQIPASHVWLQSRNINQLHHLRMFVKDDLLSLARFISGNAIGLVMSGAGAPGLAHAGVIKACEELKIPIDYLGGTSIGAIVGGAYAICADSNEMINKLAYFFVNYSKHHDYTIPITSILTGRRLSLLLKEAYGEEMLIENLWRKYFCVSTNITNNLLRIHDKDLLWLAIRASVSLPGIFPPICENGDLLVDGAIMNNLPIDIMQQRINGGKIIAVNIITNDETDNAEYSIDNNFQSGWQILIRRMISFIKSTVTSKSNNIPPTIADIIMKSMLLSSRSHQNTLAVKADYCLNLRLNNYKLLQFNDCKNIMHDGYNLAMEQLQKFDFSMINKEK